MNGLVFTFTVVFFTSAIIAKCTAFRKYSFHSPEYSSGVEATKHRNGHKHSHSKHKKLNEHTVPPLVLNYEEVPSSVTVLEETTARMSTDFGTEISEDEGSVDGLNRNSTTPDYMTDDYDYVENSHPADKSAHLHKNRQSDPVAQYDYETFRRTVKASENTTVAATTTESYRRADYTRNPAASKKIKKYTSTIKPDK